MKLSSAVLAEIVALFQRGIMEMRDVSQELRDLEFQEANGTLVFTPACEQRLAGNVSKKMIPDA